MATDHAKIAELLLDMEQLLAMKGELSAQRVKLYCAALDDIPLDQLTWAAGEICKTAKWFPVPAEMREIARSKVYSGGDEYGKWIALTGKRKKAMDALYAGEEYDYEMLAQEFENNGRVDGAAHIRKLFTEMTA